MSRRKEEEVNFETTLKRYLSSLPTDESVLIPLYEAYRAASAAMLGILNRPRVTRAAVEVIESEIERMDDRASAVAAKLSQLTSIADFWRESYLEVMLSHVFFSGAGNASEVLAKASALPVIERETAN
jgi:hypothetical protein